jgi:hypothetical protein
MVTAPGSTFVFKKILLEVFEEERTGILLRMQQSNKTILYYYDIVYHDLQINVK